MYVAVIEPHPALLGPFPILLLSIAIFPLILRQHWERHYQKLGALLATTTWGYYVFALHGAARVQHCRWRICDFHCCGRRILCRGRRNLFAHPATRLGAISVAATFFGGLTYIGNSPNLLIRAIAESRHVPTSGISSLYY
jgi:hypothetical protein